MTETIKEICQRHGMGPTALSRRFGIPRRTVEDWFAGNRPPTEYVVRMIAEILDMEKSKE